MSAQESLTPARARQLEELAQALGHSFKSLALLDQALCHASTSNQGRSSYERLEFLGDAILGFLVAETLFAQKPEIPEGELTDRRAQIVSRRPLALVADRLKLTSHLIGGRGLRDKDRQSDRIRADLVEAVLAAVYLDGGVRAARKFVKQHVLGHLEVAEGGQTPRDPKSRLLHYAQVHVMGQPRYELLRAWGPDHERHFEVGVLIQDEQLATGSGRTKQDAEKQAASRALDQFREQAEAAPKPEEH